MKKTEFHRLRIDAEECGSLEEFINKCGGSLPSEYYNESGDAQPALDLLIAVWDIAHDFRLTTVRKISGLTQRGMAQRFGVPCRTIEDWDAGNRAPTEYLLEFIAADVLTPDAE